MLKRPIRSFVIVYLALVALMFYVKESKSQAYIPVPPPVAPVVTNWTHTTNPRLGTSLMQMVQNGPAVNIFYQVPRPSMTECCGVVPGTLFFNGVWNGPVLSGYATIYHRGYWSEKYYVQGGYVAPGVLQLNGTPPDDSIRNGTLVFIQVP